MSKEAEAVRDYLGAVHLEEGPLTIVLYYDRNVWQFYEKARQPWKDLVKKATKMTDEEIDELCIQCSVLVGDIQEYKETLADLNSEIERYTVSRDNTFDVLLRTEKELSEIRSRLRGD